MTEQELAAALAHIRLGTKMQEFARLHFVEECSLSEAARRAGVARQNAHPNAKRIREILALQAEPTAAPPPTPPAQPARAVPRPPTTAELMALYVVLDKAVRSVPRGSAAWAALEDIGEEVLGRIIRAPDAPPVPFPDPPLGDRLRAATRLAATIERKGQVAQKELAATPDGAPERPAKVATVLSFGAQWTAVAAVRDELYFTFNAPPGPIDPVATRDAILALQPRQKAAALAFHALEDGAPGKEELGDEMDALTEQVNKLATLLRYTPHT